MAPNSTAPTTPPHYIMYGTGMISLTLIYVIVIVSLYINRRRPPFTSSYFKLWNMVGVVDLITIMGRFFVIFIFDANWAMDSWRDTTSGYGWFKQRIGRVILVWAGQAQFVGILLLCVNRYTSVCMPVRHSKMWNSSWIALLPWLFSMDVAAVFAHYEYVGWSASQSISRELSIAHITVIIVAIVYLQSVTYYKLVKEKKNKVVEIKVKTTNQTGGENNTSSWASSKLSATRRAVATVENRLLVNTSILVLCMIGRVVAYVVAVAVGMNLISLPFHPLELTYVSYDVFSLINPVLLLASSAHCRRLIFLSLIGGELYTIK